jgi:hypothetical protein
MDHLFITSRLIGCCAGLISASSQAVSIPAGRRAAPGNGTLSRAASSLEAVPEQDGIHLPGEFVDAPCALALDNLASGIERQTIELAERVDLEPVLVTVEMSFEASPSRKSMLSSDVEFRLRYRRVSSRLRGLAVTTGMASVTGRTKAEGRKQVRATSGERIVKKRRTFVHRNCTRPSPNYLIF